MRKLFAGAALAVSLLLSACGGGGSDAPAPEPEPVLNSTKPLDLMSFGIATYDGSGNLAISTAAPSLHFLGRATYTGLVQRSGVIGDYQRYTINSPNGVPFPVIFMSQNSGVWHEALLVSQVSGTTYELLLRTNAGAGSTQIFCFGRLADGTGPAEPYGARVLGPSGQIHFDSTRQPLLPHSLVVLPERPRNTLGPASSQSGAFWDSTPATFPANVGVFVSVYGGAAGGFQGGSTWKGAALRLGTNAIERVVGSRWGGNTDTITLTSVYLGQAPVLIVDLTPYL